MSLLPNNLKQMPLICPGHTRPVVDLSYSKVLDDADDVNFLLLSASKDGKPMLRDGATGDWLGTFEGHKGAVWSCVINGEGTRCATGSADFTTKLWDAETGSELHTFEHKHIVKAVDFSEDTRYLLTGGAEKLLNLFDLERPDATPTVLEGHEQSIRDLAVSRCGAFAFSCAEDRSLRKWDLHRLRTDIRGRMFEDPIRGLAFTADGRRLLVCSGTRVYLYDAERFDCLQTVRLPCEALTAASHLPDYMVVGGADHLVYRYELESGMQLGASKSHFGPVHAVVYAPDGAVYASASEDGTVRLWQQQVWEPYGLWRLVDGGETAQTAAPLEASAGEL